MPRAVRDPWTALHEQGEGQNGWVTHPQLIADELRALALLGLSYVRDPYDLDRYRRVLALSAELAAQERPRTSG